MSSQPAMSCVHEIITISGLAVRVYTTYKGAPKDYQHISKDVTALQSLIDKVAQYFKSPTLSCDSRHYGEEVLKGCKGVLEDLYSLIEKYKRMASINKRLVLAAVKIGKEDIRALQARLISETVLLKGFVRRCVVRFINPININILVLAVNILKLKLNWPLFLIFLVQAQKFQ